jgi:hypothetical protein
MLAPTIRKRKLENTLNPRFLLRFRRGSKKTPIIIKKILKHPHRIKYFSLNFVLMMSMKLNTINSSERAIIPLFTCFPVS